MGLAGAAKAIFWGLVLITVMLLIWGIPAVQILHPMNKEVAANGAYSDPSFCERCPRAFESVPAAMLTFTQHIIAGDSWGVVAIPIIERYPEAYIFFMLVMVSLGLAVLNLILAVVIDCAANARKETDHMIANKKIATFKKASSRLLKVCAEMDTDHSGSLTLGELEDGYRTNTTFADAMSVLDVREEDLNVVYQILDEDRSGDVRYDEFVNQLYKIKTRDPHTMLVFILHAATEVKAKLAQEMRVLKAMFLDQGVKDEMLGTSTWGSRPENAFSAESREDKSANLVSDKPGCDGARSPRSQEGANDANLVVSSPFDRIANRLQGIERTLESLARSACSAELDQEGIPLMLAESAPTGLPVQLRNGPGPLMSSTDNTRVLI